MIEEIVMSQKRRRLTAIAGLVLLVVYSLVMMATNGTATGYSWMILAGAIALVAIAARRVSTGEDEGRDG
jgi:hypothetical protein